MQMRHVSTNLRQGLRRNLSMHVAVVLTLFVSLSLAGMGVLLSKEANLITRALGNELQVQVNLCVRDYPGNPSCVGEVTDEQKREIVRQIEASPEVDSFYFESKEEGFERLKVLLGSEQFEGTTPLVTVKDIPEAIWITLKDPDESSGIVEALQYLDGVGNIQNARELIGPISSMIDGLTYATWALAAVLLAAAILLVANTIRLAALARRKEIEIMRLVGASRIFIALPFLLEALVNAAIGVALTGGVLAAFTKFGIIDGLDAQFDALPFIGWPEYWETLLLVAVAGPVLTLVPTLLLTRKYLRL
ncbi:permease-like cell division protein FtsX [Nocardioides sp. R-C-SC26]|uniref:permease-like cell division protein FtsX n=1 Tax=Nocardioides sp. R-C-SC26 TaxID=2870414 RepID=UPI001E31703B|nr:permease-like cell division protein FtsX [Nocardioides sp. R-C-SC26]